MQSSIRRPKAVFACGLARGMETLWSRSMIVVRVYRPSTTPKSSSVFTGWTKRAPVTKEVQAWAYRLRTGASGRMAAKLSLRVTSNVDALFVSGCRKTDRVTRTRKQPRTQHRLSAFARLVARFGLCVRGIKARQRDSIFHLLHDPGLETFLFGRSRQDFIQQSRGNQRGAIIIEHHYVVGKHGHASATNRLLPVSEGEPCHGRWRGGPLTPDGQPRGQHPGNVAHTSVCNYRRTPSLFHAGAQNVSVNASIGNSHRVDYGNATFRHGFDGGPR